MSHPAGKLANPAPLGLLGFGLTTIMLNLHNAGFFPLTSSILAMGIFFGGIAQMIAGIEEWKVGNTFGATAFTSYGAFWLSLVGLIALPKMGFTPDNGTSMAAYLGVWGIFSFFMFIGTLRLTRCQQLIFGTLTLLFLLLSIEKATGSEEIAHIAGYDGIVCGGLALYCAVAQVINEVYGRTVFPLGAPKK